METWRLVWRRAVACRLPTRGLEALAEALASDDPRLLQGVTSLASEENGDECAAACPIGYAGWKGGAGNGTFDVEAFFGRVMFEAGRVLGEESGGRWFANWFDDMPRDEARRELLHEVQRSLAMRGVESAVAAKSGAAG